MANEEGILFKIKGDSSDAEGAFKRTTAAGKESTESLTAAFAKGTVAGNFLHDAISKIADIAIQAGPALFKLATTAGEYADQIYDAAQKTNVGTDALQTLKVAAEQSGSSFETLEKSLAKFSALLGQAAIGNKKAEETLLRYGITATNTDEALLQAIKTIHGYSSATVQNAAAAELFKDKSGAMINIIREMDGDLEGLTDDLKKTGQIMGKDAVKAGADFTDQMDTLDKQLAAVGKTIGTELIPVFNTMAQDVSTWLMENQGAVKTWGKTFATIVTTSAKAIEGFALNVQALNVELEALKDVGDMGPDYQKRAADRDARRAVIGRKLAGGGTDLPGRIQLPTLKGTGSGGAPMIPFDAPYTNVFGGAKSMPRDLEAEEEAAKAAEKRRKEREAAAKRDRDNQSKYLDLQIKAIREYYLEQQEAAEKAFTDRTDTEKEFTEKSGKILAKYRTDTEAYLNAAFKVDAVGKNADEIQNLGIEKTQAIATIGREVSRQLIDNAKLVADVNKKTADEDEEAHKVAMEWLEALEKERAKNFIKEFEDANKLLKIEEEIRDVHRDRLKAAGEAYGDSVLGKEPALHGSIGGGFLDSLGIAKDAVEESTDIMGDAMQKLGDMAGEMFAGMAQGIGNMVEQWVLYGTAGPDALRKMTAALLANLAAQATVEAIMELARGFAALARYDPVSATLHFKSAAVFGAVAVAAAVTGRAVAGNSFSKGGGATASASASPGSFQDTSAISRSSSTAGTSGRQTLEGQMLGLSQAVDGLNNKIGSMQPYEVMTRAENQRPGITAAHAVNGIAANGGLGTRLQRVTGARR